MWTIPFLLILLFLTFSFLFLYRNEKVCKYQQDLNDRGYQICVNYLHSIPSESYDEEACKKHEELRKQWHSIVSISYDKMLWQFWKPLKDKYWLTKEQIEFLNTK